MERGRQTGRNVTERGQKQVVRCLVFMVHYLVKALHTGRGGGLGEAVVETHPANSSLHLHFPYRAPGRGFGFLRGF